MDFAGSDEQITRQRPYRDTEHLAHCAAIGYVASEWAIFEMQVDSMTIALINVEFVSGVCLTAQVAGSARKLDAYIAAARHRGAAALAGELERFAKDTAGLAEQRNRIVHDAWFMPTGSPVVRLEMTARRKVSFRTIEVSTESMLDLAFKIFDHTLRFFELNARVLDAIDASPERPPPASA